MLVWHTGCSQRSIYPHSIEVVRKLVEDHASCACGFTPMPASGKPRLDAEALGAGNCSQKTGLKPEKLCWAPSSEALVWRRPRKHGANFVAQASQVSVGPSGVAHLLANMWPPLLGHGVATGPSQDTFAKAHMHTLRHGELSHAMHTEIATTLAIDAPTELRPRIYEMMRPVCRRRAGRLLAHLPSGRTPHGVATHTSERYHRAWRSPLATRAPRDLILCSALMPIASMHIIRGFGATASSPAPPFPSAFFAREFPGPRDTRAMKRDVSARTR